MPPKVHKFEVPERKAQEFIKKSGLPLPSALGAFYWMDDVDGVTTFHIPGLFKAQQKRLTKTAEALGGKCVS